MTHMVRNHYQWFKCNIYPHYACSTGATWALLLTSFYYKSYTMNNVVCRGNELRLNECSHDVHQWVMGKPLITECKHCKFY